MVHYQKLEIPRWKWSKEAPCHESVGVPPFQFSVDIESIFKVGPTIAIDDRSGIDESPSLGNSSVTVDGIAVELNTHCSN